MRKTIVAGNWKMHCTRSQATELLNTLKTQLMTPSIDVIVFPPFIHLALTEQILAKSAIAWGAQNLYLGDTGAFTGEISGMMLHEYGCRYVLVGHSERRHILQEDLTVITAKFIAAQAAQLTPVLCVGETEAQRIASKTEQVLQEQLSSVLSAVGIEAFRSAIIAYEPVWAIGTGLTATPEQAQAAHAYIRQLLAKHDKNIANQISLLYGGSVKADNAAGLFAMPDIDGALVGGASLNAQSFSAICQAATNIKLPIEG